MSKKCIYGNPDCPICPDDVAPASRDDVTKPYWDNVKKNMGYVQVGAEWLHPDDARALVYTTWGPNTGMSPAECEQTNGR